MTTETATRPASNPDRWRRVHIEGDNRAPVGMMARPSLFIRVQERMGL